MNKTLTPRVSNRRCSRQLLDEIFVQPWFVDRRTAAAIRHLIPDHVFRKMRLYFDDWGCLVCRSRRRTTEPIECVISALREFKRDWSVACKKEDYPPGRPMRR